MLLTQGYDKLVDLSCPLTIGIAGPGTATANLGLFTSASLGLGNTFKCGLPIKIEESQRQHLEANGFSFSILYSSRSIKNQYLLLSVLRFCNVRLEERSVSLT